MISFHKRKPKFIPTIGWIFNDRLDGDRFVVKNDVDFRVERVARFLTVAEVNEGNAAFGLEQNADAQVTEFAELNGVLLTRFTRLVLLWKFK